jgi:hypothetical protein
MVIENTPVVTPNAATTAHATEWSPEALAAVRRGIAALAAAQITPNAALLSRPCECDHGLGVHGPDGCEGQYGPLDDGEPGPCGCEAYVPVRAAERSVIHA